MRHGLYRPAFTLIELLVVIAVMALLLALLLPALQQVRDAAHATRCRSHLRQLALAARAFETEQGHFPAGHWKQDDIEHGWAPSLLPYLDQRPLAEQYSWSASWHAPANAAVIATPLSFFQCPAAPPNRMDEFLELDKNTGAVKKQYRAAAGDYFPTRGVGKKLAELGYIDPLADYSGILSKVDIKAAKDGREKEKEEEQKNLFFTRADDVRDGLSNTILFSECGGRPTMYRRGLIVPHPEKVVKGAGWASHESGFDVKGHSPDGLQEPGPAVINVTNHNGVYSFHRAGAHVVFGDSSVRLVRPTVSIRIFAAWVTRNGGEIALPNFD